MKGDGPLPRPAAQGAPATRGGVTRWRAGGIVPGVRCLAGLMREEAGDFNCPPPLAYIDNGSRINPALLGGLFATFVLRGYHRGSERWDFVDKGRGGWG